MKNLGENYNELYLESMRQQKNELEKVLENNSYMQWLENFAKMHPYFTDDSWLYDCSEIGDENYSNVIMLSHLFYVVENYANRNGIAPNLDGCNMYYIISFNNVYYAIGHIIGSIFYCKRKNGKWHAISFDDITSDFKNSNCDILF